MVRICFVCLGNICRSPTADGIMRHLVREAGLDRAIEIDSAGTAAYHTGEPADGRSRATAKRFGVDLPSIARQFVVEDFVRFDYVLAMDQSNFVNLVSLTDDETKRKKVRMFRSFDSSAPPEAEVPDPYYGGARGFEDVFEICRSGCEALLAHVRREHGL